MELHPGFHYSQIYLLDPDNPLVGDNIEIIAPVDPIPQPQSNAANAIIDEQITDAVHKFWAISNLEIPKMNTRVIKKRSRGPIKLITNKISCCEPEKR